MKYFKDRPLGLWILAVSVILFTIYYHIRPFLWGADASIYSPMFELTLWGFVIWFNIILEIIGMEWTPNSTQPVTLTRRSIGVLKWLGKREYFHGNLKLKLSEKLKIPKSIKPIINAIIFFN